MNFYLASQLPFWSLVINYFIWFISYWFFTKYRVPLPHSMDSFLVALRHPWKFHFSKQHEHFRADQWCISLISDAALVRVKLCFVAMNSRRKFNRLLYDDKREISYSIQDAVSMENSAELWKYTWCIVERMTHDSNISFICAWELNKHRFHSKGLIRNLYQFHIFIAKKT